ncbi:MAG: hypothetical protein M1830_005601 [Pleopsidium flavum]|nr:MAG: hypothetical protein M1830_005601 [Pleopsidium flavum]
MSEMPPQWFDTKLQAATTTDAEGPSSVKPDEVRTMKTFLDNQTTAIKAAESLTKRTSTAANLSDVYESLSALWTFLTDLAIDMPSSQPKLIELLKAIQNLPDVELPGGEGADYISLEQGELWKELPQWGNIWADTFNSVEASFTKPVDSTTESVRNGQMWAAITAFSARLAAEDAAQLNGGGFLLSQGYRGIVRALEQEGVDLNSEIPAAAQWFIHSGPKLYNHGRTIRHDEPSGNGNGLWFKDGYGKPLSGLWKGEGGLNKGRWLFWKERFTWVRENMELGEEARRAAKDAVEAMTKVEKEG